MCNTVWNMEGELFNKLNLYIIDMKLTTCQRPSIFRVHNTLINIDSSGPSRMHQPYVDCNALLAISLTFDLYHHDERVFFCTAASERYGDIGSRLSRPIPSPALFTVCNAMSSLVEAKGREDFVTPNRGT